MKKYLYPRYLKMLVSARICWALGKALISRDVSPDILESQVRKSRDNDLGLKMLYI